jgi:hypothetical protein
MEIRSTGEDAYFAASNSTMGFTSYYPQCFDAARIGHVYAIKGGPGTGKSHFMRTVANDAKERGVVCEYVYCSSDADSLDGVILTEGERCIALLDATAPHTYELKNPGVREDLIDLGAFWDGKKLRAYAQEIGQLNAEKQEAYRMAYRYLAAFGVMCANRDELVSPYLRTDAMEQWAERLLWDVLRGSGFSSTPALIRSIGMQGEVAFDTYFARAERIWLVEDCRGCSQYLMRMLYRLCERKRLSLRISYDPLLPDRIDGIFLCDRRWAFVVAKPSECQYPYKKLSTRRFVDTAGLKRIKPRVNHAEQMMRAMKGGAIEALSRARTAHFDLERIYTAAMDFDAKEEYTKRFCDSLFPLQNS